MLLVDVFEISIFNDQIANVIQEFQSSKGKQGIPRLEFLTKNNSISLINNFFPDHLNKI